MFYETNPEETISITREQQIIKMFPNISGDEYALKKFRREERMQRISILLSRIGLLIGGLMILLL